MRSLRPVQAQDRFSGADNHYAEFEMNRSLPDASPASATALLGHTALVSAVRHRSVDRDPSTMRVAVPWKAVDGHADHAYVPGQPIPSLPALNLKVAA